MNRVFVTGDKHRAFYDLSKFCCNLTDYEDWMIILGDNGVNWYGDDKDEDYKEYLSKIPVRFMMIRGNHDMRPEDATFKLSNGETVPKYESCKIDTPSISGNFWMQKNFPNLFFAQDGETYRIGNDTSAFVIGGAYSIDKFYRLAKSSIWFPNEQLNEQERSVIGRKFYSFVASKKRNHISNLLVFSHTCPFRFVPHESKIPGINPEFEDYTMEHWMDELYEGSDNQIDAWYCGHWHTNKFDNPMTFLYEDIREINYNGGTL